MEKVFEELYKQHISYLIGESTETDPILEGNLSHLDFIDLCLDGRNISNANFSNSVFKNVDMRCCIFHSCNFSGTRFINCKMTCSEFNGSNFKFAKFDNCHAAACSFDSTTIYRTLVLSSVFDRSVFFNSILTGGGFHRCSLNDVNMNKTVFVEAPVLFDRCMVKGISIKHITGIGNIDMIDCFDGESDHIDNKFVIKNNKLDFIKYFLSNIGKAIKMLTPSNNGKRLQIQDDSTKN